MPVSGNHSPGGSNPMRMPATGCSRAVASLTLTTNEPGMAADPSVAARGKIVPCPWTS